MMFKEWIEFIGFKIVLFVVSFLPFRFLYCFSDFLAFVLNYIIKYRKKIIEKNLKNSFPRIVDKELKRIKRIYYKNIMDVFVETIKGFSVSHNIMKEKFHFENLSTFDDLYKKNQSCILLMSHYSNWELITNISEGINHSLCSLYKPLRNKKIDNILKRQRQKNGMILYSPRQTGFMIKNNIDNPSVFIYIADQSPVGDIDKEFWIDFLNQKTAVIPGADILARKFNLPVFYLHIHRERRGFYKGSILPVEAFPEQTNKGEISRKYMKILEGIIIQKPEYWLWSHNRWKRKIPNYIASDN